MVDESLRIFFYSCQIVEYYEPKITIFTIKYCVRYMIEEKKAVSGCGVPNKRVDISSFVHEKININNLCCRVPINVNLSICSVYYDIIKLLYKILNITCMILK